MGPLFSFFLMMIGAGALLACIFCIFRFKYPTWLAFVCAAVFVAGAATALVLATLAAVLITGLGATLTSTLAVGLFLAWLAAASVAGGLAAVCLVPRLTPRLWLRLSTV